MRKLFLDDIRTPPDSTWDVVRSYASFVAYIEANGMPDIISFDHDLADEHYIIGEPSDYKEFDYTACKELTGYDCAKWLVENYGAPKEWYVHSMNPCGRQNIEAALRGKQTSRESEK